MLNIKQEEMDLNKAKQEINQCKETKIKAETRLEQLNKEQEEIIKQIKELGYNPDTLENDIAAQEQEYLSMKQELIDLSNGLINF